MRTTLDIDATLLREAMKRSHARTKTQAIEQGLKELINAERLKGLIAMRGKGYGMSLQEFLRSRRDE